MISQLRGGGGGGGAHPYGRLVYRIPRWVFLPLHLASGSIRA